MADIFDNKEEIKKQIEEIVSNTQKCILCEAEPYGHYIYGSGYYTSAQRITYKQNVNALLFTSNNRVCLLEKKTEDGGLYWILKGNGNYSLSKNTILSNNYGFDIDNKVGVPSPPSPQNWDFSLEGINNWVDATSNNFNTMYNTMTTATSGSVFYGVSPYNFTTKEFYKNTSTINDNFKIGYIEEYALTNSRIAKNNSPDFGTVSNDYAFWNFTSNTDLYNRAVNTGYIPFTKVNRNSPSFEKLSPNQAYVDLDIPLAGHHRFYNIIVTSDEEQANDYINNGTIPDDARIIDDKGEEVTLKEEDDGKESDGYKQDKWIDTEENTHPVQSQLSTGTNFFYKMTTAELTAFFTWFWNDIDLTDILINTVTGLYNNMAECVLNLKYYPLKPTNADFFRLNDNSIVLGRFKTDETYKKINSCAGNGKLCRFNITDNFDKYSLYSSKSRPHAFTDYAPYTDLYVYLPFYGYHKLDTNMCMERPINITYSLDITTGALDYNIKIGGTTVDTLSCNFGIDVPYTLSSMLELGSNVAKSVVDVAVSAGTSIANNFQSSVIPSDDSGEREVPKSSKGGSNLVGNSFAPPALNINGKISNGVGLYHCLKPFLIIKHPRYYRASNYGKIEGYPCMKAYKLNTIKGYTECERPQIQKFTHGTPTADEIGELLNILSNGIVIK